MTGRSALAVGAVLAGLVATPPASAKNFGPGDLRICNANRCAAIVEQQALEALSAFYFTGVERPVVVTSPRLGAPAFQLRFRNGYVTGIVATARLDRFLSYGVHLERFAQARWYRLPAGAARELRALTRGLRPLRVTRAALARSR